MGEVVEKGVGESWRWGRGISEDGEGEEGQRERRDDQIQKRSWGKWDGREIAKRELRKIQKEGRV